jgi:glutamate 5-kinase
VGVKSKAATIAEKQAFASIGQARIMNDYAELFGRHGILVGQMLLSRGDMEDRRRYLNARYTLEELMRRRCVPIINENDTVTVDELKFGDNDGLAALVAVKMQAGALVLLSDVDGLFDGNPKVKRDAKLLEQVDRVTPSLIEELCAPAKGGPGVGSGGMTSKLRAARMGTAAGVAVCIANGKVPGQLRSILDGRFRGTYFPAHDRQLSRRQGWIFSGRSVSPRRVVVDDGARTALVTGHKSLLPAGIRSVEGRFQPGQIVEVMDLQGVLLARGIVNYSSAELEQIRGRKTAEIGSILGERHYDEAIHRDNLVLAPEFAGK